MSQREKHSRQHWTNRTRWNESYKVLNSAKHRLRTYITIIGTFLPPSVVQCSYDVKLSLCEIYAVRSFNRPHFFLSLSKLACVPYEFQQRLSSTTFFWQGRRFEMPGVFLKSWKNRVCGLILSENVEFLLRNLEKKNFQKPELFVISLIFLILQVTLVEVLFTDIPAVPWF